MTPIILKIKGIYSYQQETEIDFSKLTEAGLFGIFGAVGSGKSTILEAIAFALYGETERLNSRESRSYNMMNLKSNELLVDFQFRAGEENQLYHFTVNCKRNSKRFEDVKSFSRSAYIWESNKWVPLEKTTAEDLIGLSYDNFKRTIIIPQGKFQEFLQLSDTDRTRMLKEIFNLQKFELSGKVSDLEKENNTVMENLKGQLVQLQNPDKENLEAREKEINELAGTVLSKEDIFKETRAQEAELNKLKELFLDVEKQKSIVLELKEKEEHFSQRESKLREFEKCHRLFFHVLENRKKALQKLESIVKDKENKEKELVKLEAEKQKLEEQFQKIKPAFDNREQLLKKSEELGKIIEITTLTSEIDTLNSRIFNGSQTIKLKEEEQEKINDFLRKLKDEIKQQKSSLPDLNLLSNIKIWFNNNKNLEKEKSNLQQQIKETLSSIESVKEGIKVQTQQLPDEVPATKTDFEEIKASANELLAKWQNEIQNAEEKLSTLSVHTKLEEFANELKPGSPCALCGSTSHPEVFSAEGAREQLNELSVIIAKLKADERKLNENLNKLAAPFSKLDVLQSHLVDLQNNEKQMKQKLEAHQGSFSFNGFSPTDEESVNQAFESSKNLELQLKEQELLREKEEEKLETTRKETETYRKAIDTFKNELSSKQSKAELLENQLSLFDFQEMKTFPVEELQSRKTSLQNEYNELTTTFGKIEKQLQETQSKCSLLTGKLEEINGNLNNQETEAKELGHRITSLLKENGFANEGEVSSILSRELNIEHERQQIENFRQHLHTATAQWGAAKKKVEGKVYDNEMHKNLILKLEALKHEIEELKKKHTTLSLELKKLKDDLEKRTVLETELEKLILRGENLSTLRKMFAGSGFVNFVSSVYLKNLLNAANSRFHKLTRQKLMLELTENNGFQVRDFMNNGEVRNVKTLSGGQTFQASLCLAIALADNIQHITKSPQNFFFLDEGFGSLDKESLNIVFETLKSLRKENRIVGVISHVDEMQQEIGMHLRVVNHEEKGSLVSKSWEG